MLLSAFAVHTNDSGFAIPVYSESLLATLSLAKEALKLFVFVVHEKEFYEGWLHVRTLSSGR